MELGQLIISLISCGFFFLLGWLIGVERNNYLTKELTFWKAYAREQDQNIDQYNRNRSHKDHIK